MKQVWRRLNLQLEPARFWSLLSARLIRPVIRTSMSDGASLWGSPKGGRHGERTNAGCRDRRRRRAQ